MKDNVIKCVGQPEDLANIIVFLASDKTRHITGDGIKVDSGKYF